MCLHYSILLSLQRIKKNFDFKIQTIVEVLGTRASSTGQENHKDENAVYDPDKVKPRVELKVLVGVNAEAVEISGSTAGQYCSCNSYFSWNDNVTRPACTNLSL